MLGLGLNMANSGLPGGFTNLQSVFFPGDDEYGNIDALQAQISLDTQGTMFSLLKTDDVTPAATCSIMTFGDTDGLESIRLDLVPAGNLRGFCRIGGSVIWNMDTDVNGLTNDTWHLVGMIHDGVSPILKIDDTTPAITFTTSDGTPTQWMAAATGLDNGRIAGVEINSTGTTGLCKGNLDEFGYFNIGLSAAEWTELYNILVLKQKFGDLRNHSRAANLVSSYHVDGDIVPTMVDYVNGHNGTYVNTVQSEIQDDVV